MDGQTNKTVPIPPPPKKNPDLYEYLNLYERSSGWDGQWPANREKLRRGCSVLTAWCVDPGERAQTDGAVMPTARGGGRSQTGFPPDVWIVPADYDVRSGLRHRGH